MHTHKTAIKTHADIHHLQPKFNTSRFPKVIHYALLPFHWIGTKEKLVHGACREARLGGIGHGDMIYASTK